MSWRAQRFPALRRNDGPKGVGMGVGSQEKPVDMEEPVVPGGVDMMNQMIQNEQPTIAQTRENNEKLRLP